MNSAVAGLFGAVLVGLLSFIATVVYALTHAEQPDNFGDHGTFTNK